MKIQKTPALEQGSVQGKTILIVEDEKSLRDAIVDILQLKKFNSLSAKNGKEGVKMALREHPDLVLLDLIMPEMDGMTALKKIREDAWGAKVPIIILTNLSAINGNLAADALTHTPTSYLIKSDWKLYDIIKKIEKVLKMPKIPAGALGIGINPLAASIITDLPLTPDDTK